jgi:3alpha(or 20beta)-hydroxysteroid dehydrogenase
MSQLQNKVALVSGGARGIGGAAATALCDAGAAVVIGDMLAEVGEAKAAELRAAGHRATFVTLDVRQAADWAAAVERAGAEYGGLDILLNNAGISISKTIEDATEADFRHIFDINVMGVFLGMQTAIPALRARGGGAIINISSNSTQKIVALASIYSATKAAVANLTKTTAVHCAQYNIRVNSIHPGPTETAMLLGSSRDADLPAVRAMINAIPMGRMGKPPEIASVAVFLASDASAYMTGAELFVDGGVTMV